MNKYSTYLLFVTFLFTFVAINGQQILKIGHINSQELLASMPASDSAQKKLEITTKEYQASLDQMTLEYNKMLETYFNSSKAVTLSDQERFSKETELEGLENRLQTFEQTAQQDIQQKRIELFNPIQEKALLAVRAVAEENGFSYIFDTGIGSVVYTSPDSPDILPLVEQKLGIKNIESLPSKLYANTQNDPRFGYINSQKLMVSMSACNRAQKKLEIYAHEYEKKLEKLTEEFNNKFNSYQLSSTTIDQDRASKEAELQDLSNRIQNFKQTAQEDLQIKRNELFAPIQEAILSSIKSIAEEKKLNYVVDSFEIDLKQGSIIYITKEAPDFSLIALNKEVLLRLNREGNSINKLENIESDYTAEDISGEPGEEMNTISNKNLFNINLSIDADNESNIRIKELLTEAKIVCAEINIKRGINQRKVLVYDLVGKEERTLNTDDRCEYKLLVEVETIDQLPNQIVPGMYQGMPYTEIRGQITLSKNESVIHTQYFKREISGGINISSYGTSPVWMSDEAVSNEVLDRIRAIIF